MKIAYKHIVSNFEINPSINEVSEKLFQLGHENEIVENNILNIEFTPNRGDCLSVNGIVRDLGVFYKKKNNVEIYKDNIENLNFNFTNESKESCPNISFLRLQIDGEIKDYKDNLKSYFEDLNVNKNNFFTDISNYLSYETGQPTHCYDAKKLDQPLILKEINDDREFKTLTNKVINLTGNNLIFSMSNHVINLAGVMGGKGTACDQNTNDVIVECAYFKPEKIIGQAIKYDLLSDASYKYERGADPLCHEHVLRRFIKVVQDHASVKNIQLYQDKYQEFPIKKIPLDIDKINRIIGMDIKVSKFKNILLSLGFSIKNNKILVPTFRNDIESQNDLAEEVARVIGYDDIPLNKINIPSTKTKVKINHEKDLKNILIDNGFYEVINNPFVKDDFANSVKVDNPLDSNKNFLRLDLKKSLIQNLLYNEKRQKDSVKLFEISDVYSLYEGNYIKKRKIGIIASGRAGNNYIDFSKKINKNYVLKSLEKLGNNLSNNLEIIERDSLDTKSKNEIVYIELDVDDILLDIKEYESINNSNLKFVKYIPISEFPSSIRDLSFSLENPKSLNQLQDLIFNFQDKLLKDVFIFDYYNNEKKQEIKIGFRFLFQSVKGTLTEKEINSVIDKIIAKTTNLESVNIPGLVK